VDTDEVEELCERFDIELLPQVLFLRGGAEKSNVVATIKGGGPAFITEFPKMLTKVSNEQELQLLRNFQNNTPGKNIGAVLQNIACTKEHVQKLALQPLEDCAAFVTRYVAGRSIRFFSNILSSILSCIFFCKAIL
jgi:hypothetical protein